MNTDTNLNGQEEIGRLRLSPRSTRLPSWPCPVTSGMIRVHLHPSVVS
jgi:hypothetical protein